jgi:hypothetical protein
VNVEVRSNDQEIVGKPGNGVQLLVLWCAETVMLIGMQ